MGIHGGDLHDGEKTNVADAKACQKLCQNRSDCLFWTFGLNVWQNVCWLKHSKGGRKFQSGLISGPKVCSKLKFKFWKFSIPNLLINLSQVETKLTCILASI